MDKRSMKWSLVAAAAACVAVAAMPGCELLVDFDRSKIPQDAGSVGDATMDAPEMDGQGGDSTTDAPMMGDAPSDGPVSEAGGDASDGGGDAESDAADGGGMDAMVDAPSEAATDAGSDASDGAVGTAAFTISPAAVNFGTVAQGTTTAGYALTVTNNGTASGTPTITPGGTNAGDFTATGCGTPVAVGMTCTLMVTFTPGGSGSRGPATISVGSGTPAALSGTGAATGTLTIAPASHDFGTVTAGMASSDFGFTVTNTDAVNAVTLTGPTLDGQGGPQFAFDSDGGAGQCSGTLAPSGTCTVFVHFTPATGIGTGFQYGSVSITGAATDGGASPGTASASVTGTGQ